MEAPDGVLGGHLPLAPRWLGLDAWHPSQGEPHPIRVLEREYGFAKALLDRFVRNPPLDKAVRPIADRALRDPEHGLLRLAHADPTRGDMLPGEERQDGSGPARLIAVVEVIRTRIVEV